MSRWSETWVKVLLKKTKIYLMVNRSSE